MPPDAAVQRRRAAVATLSSLHTLERCVHVARATPVLTREPLRPGFGRRGVRLLRVLRLDAEEAQLEVGLRPCCRPRRSRMASSADGMPRTEEGSARAKVGLSDGTGGHLAAGAALPGCCSTPAPFMVGLLLSAERLVPCACYGGCLTPRVASLARKHAAVVHRWREKTCPERMHQAHADLPAAAVHRPLPPPHCGLLLITRQHSWWEPPPAAHP